MRYIAFPSYESKDEIRPNLHDLIVDSDIVITAGPTPSGVYIVTGSPESIEDLRFLADPYYIFMEDFEITLM